MLSQPPVTTSILLSHKLWASGPVWESALELWLRERFVLVAGGRVVSG